MTFFIYKRKYKNDIQSVDKTPRFFLMNKILMIFFNISIKLSILDDNVSGFFPTLSFLIAIFFMFWAAQISHV